MKFSIPHYIILLIIGLTGVLFLLCHTFLAHPNVIWFAGVVAIILYLLCRKSHKHLKRVRFPWKELFIENKPKASVTPPIWLWILLVALIFLATALSLPFNIKQDKGAKCYIVMVESGIESKSKEQGGVERMTLFKDALLRLADKANPSDQFLPIRVGVNPKVEDSWMKSNQFKKTIRNIESGDAQSDWKKAFSAIEHIVYNKNFVYVIVGGQPEKVYKEWINGSRLPEQDHLFIRKGRTVPNVGIEYIQVFKSPFSENLGDIEVFIQIRAYNGDESRKVVVSINNKQVGKANLSIKENDSKLIPIKGLPEEGLLEVKLTPSDDQPYDDIAYAVIPTVDKIEVGVISSSPANLIKALSNISVINVQELNQENINKNELPHILILEMDLINWDSSIPQCNRIFFSGPGSKSAAMAVKPLQIKADHPLTKDLTHLDFNKIMAWPSEGSKKGAAILVTPINISGPIFPLVSSETSGRFRSAYFHFDAFSSIDFSRYRTIPVLIINALEWLAPYASLSSVVTAGTDYSLNGLPGIITEDIKLSKSPGKNIQFINISDDSISARKLEFAGIYSLTSGEKQLYRFAVNAKSSPVIKEKGLEETSIISSTVKDTREEQILPLDFVWWTIGLFLILLETMVYLKSSRLADELYAVFSQRKSL